MEYKITLNTFVKVSDSLTDNKILEQNFSSSTTYKLQNQYSDTVKLENKSMESLINKTYQDLLIKMSENISTK